MTYFAFLTGSAHNPCIPYSYMATEVSIRRQNKLEVGIWCIPPQYIPGCAPWGVELGPHITQCCPGQGQPPYQEALWSIQTFGHNRHGPKIGRGLCPFFGRGELGAHLAQCGLGQGLPPRHVTSWSIQPFGHNRYGPKIGGCAPLEEGQLGPHLTQCGQRRGLPACQVSPWSIQPFGHNTAMSQTGEIDRTGHDRQYRETMVWTPKNVKSTDSTRANHPVALFYHSQTNLCHNLSMQTSKMSANLAKLNYCATELQNYLWTEIRR